MYYLPSSYVLMLHHVTDAPEVVKSSCLLNTEAFQRFIDLNKNYVPVDEIVKKPSCGGVAVTFDDGLEDLYTIAYPFLKSRGIPFTAFIVTGFLDTPGYITTQQLLEMSADALVTIGAHGVNHGTLTGLSSAEKKTELVQSKKNLEELTGKPVRYYAYSHGQYDTEVLKTARIYNAAFSTSERPHNFVSACSRYTIPRFNIDSTTIEAQTQFFKSINRKV